MMAWVVPGDILEPIDLTPAVISAIEAHLRKASGI